MSETHHALLAAGLRDRAVWEAFDASGEAALSGDELAPFVDAIRAYYDADAGATRVDPALLRATAVDSIRDPKRKAIAAAILDGLVTADPSIKNAKEAVRALTGRRVGEELATKLLLGSKRDVIAPLLDRYIEATSPPAQDAEIGWSAEALAPATGTPRVPIYPSNVAGRLRGGLWPGHHMIVFARPEIGKTAFTLNVAVRAASNGKARVLYLSNEDSVRDLMLRALVLFNRTGVDEVLRDLPGAVDKARKYGADRLLFRDMAPGSLAEVDRLVRQYKPDLLVVDQLRNMGVGKVENLTQRLDAAAQGVRNVAKRHGCAAISVTQAGDSARDKAVLDDGDVDSSNTGISAGCDVLIGIGATPVMREAGERRLTLIKNKLGGSHGYLDVRLDPMTLEYRN